MQGDADCFIISSGVLLNPEGGGSLLQAPLANRIL
jgi:hypothetical protein